MRLCRSLRGANTIVLLVVMGADETEANTRPLRIPGEGLSAEQGKNRLEALRVDTLRGKRNHAMLSVGWQRWSYSHGSNSFLGEENRGFMDRIGVDRHGASVPIDQRPSEFGETGLCRK